MEKSRFTCDWIFNTLVVLSDGKVVCGCADPYGMWPLGYLKENSLYEIWASEKVKAVRDGLNQGYSTFCVDCGLKRELKADEEITVQPVNLETLPRIFLEPTVLCNLSCFQAVCNQESGILASRERKSFPFDEFKKLMDEVGKGLIRLDFFNYGDPLVHPQAIEMIEYIKRQYPHVFLYISTNGLMLDEVKIRRLVACGLDEITFSVDGPDQETYIQYRQGGDFKKILDIMSIFVAERNKVGWEVPFINWRYILFRWNDSRKKMNQTRKLAADIGVDRLTWEITNHPEPAISKKYQIGTRHWKKIYAEIWDSSQVGNAVKKNRLLAKIKVLPAGIMAACNETVNVEVKIKNIGGALWRKTTYSGRRIIRLGAQLFNKERQLIDLNYARVFLNHDISFGEKDIIEITLPALSQASEYWLKFDMVSEGIDWFESGGSQVVWQKFTVGE